jgi:hypothetical protein
MSKMAELQTAKTEGKSKTHYHWLAAGTYHIHNSGNVGRKVSLVVFRALEYAYCAMCLDYLPDTL